MQEIDREAIERYLEEELQKRRELEAKVQTVSQCLTQRAQELLNDYYDEKHSLLPEAQIVTDKVIKPYTS